MKRRNLEFREWETARYGTSKVLLAPLSHEGHCSHQTMTSACYNDDSVFVRLPVHRPYEYFSGLHE
eukprot:48653-Eustigmatos_ZCMA.PRE.1